MPEKDDLPPQPRLKVWPVLMGFTGQLLLVLMQSELLVSRHPVRPLLFFIGGVLLLQPMFAFFGGKWAEEGALSPAPLSKQLSRSTLRQFAFTHRYDLIWMLGLSGVALLLGADRMPLQPSASAWNSLWLALSVPVIYGVGFVLAGRWMALFSAGFMATSSWGLALIKADGPYSLVVLIASLYLLALLGIYRWKSNLAALALGGLFITGLWVFPGFLVNGLLALCVIVLTHTWGPRWRRWASGGRLLTLLALGVGLSILIEAILHDTSAPALANPQFSLLESLSTSLLMFNLTSDPTPLHGIVYRPVLVPLAAAGFLTGMLALAWRLYARRAWVDALPLVALIIGLIPAALPLAPPVRYPDLQQGAAALPVVMLIAGGGMACLCHVLVLKLDKLGVILVTVLLGVVLLLCFQEARLHYQYAVEPLLMRLFAT